MRLKKAEIDQLGADVYVVVAMNLYRTHRFKENNLMLTAYPSFKKSFFEQPDLVFGTALADSSGRISAMYGVSRKCFRWGNWVENNPCWFVINRQGNITYKAHPTFNSPTSYVADIDNVLKALKKAARE